MGEGRKGSAGRASLLFFLLPALLLPTQTLASPLLPVLAAAQVHPSLEVAAFLLGEIKGLATSDTAERFQTLGLKVRRGGSRG